MEARVKPMVLPDVPHYEGNVGHRPDVDIEVVYARDGSILRTERVNVASMRLAQWTHKPGRPRKPKIPKERQRRAKAGQEVMEKVQAMMNEGKSTKEISEAIGKPEYSVRRYKRKIRGDKA